MRKTISIIVLVAVALITAGSLTGIAADNNTVEIPSIDFRGKVVMLAVDSTNVLQTENNSEYLDSPVIEKIGERLFITGTAHMMSKRTDETESDWREGSQVGVAWERVQFFYTYSPEQFEKVEKTLHSLNN